MRHVLTLGETEHHIWLARKGESYALDLGGQSVPVALTPQGGDRYTLTIDGRSVPVFVAVDGDHVHVHLDGVAHELVLHDPVRRFADAAGGAAGNAAIAPMPGRVIATPVAAGAEVKPGDVLIVIESMKLETAIKSPRAGIVEKLHLEVGQTFERDATLVSLVPVGEA